MEQEHTNIFQKVLRKCNQHFRQKQLLRQFTIDPQMHVIDRKYGTVKNLLRLTNKTMIGFKSIKINKAAILSGLLGLGLGYLSAQIDTKMNFFLRNYKQTVKEGLINEVLRNQDIKDKLNSALLSNVYTNPDIQFNLHQTLITKAINPQMEDLFLLSKRGILETLNSQHVKQNLFKVAAKTLKDNEPIIAKLALQFLGGSIMDKLIAQQVSSILASEQTNQQVSLQLKNIVKISINSPATSESLYNIIRQRFLST